jgi:hypothetical protein
MAEDNEERVEPRLIPNPNRFKPWRLPLCSVNLEPSQATSMMQVSEAFVARYDGRPQCTGIEAHICQQQRCRVPRFREKWRHEQGSVRGWLSGSETPDSTCTSQASGRSFSLPACDRMLIGRVAPSAFRIPHSSWQTPMSPTWDRVGLCTLCCSGLCESRAPVYDLR